MSDLPIKPAKMEILRWFSKVGIAAFSVVTAIIVAGLIGINMLVSPLAPVTAKIHAASGQAIRAQTISILATNLAQAKRPGMLYTYRTQLDTELNEFEAVHRGLMFGDANRRISGSMSPRVREHLSNPTNGLDRFARDFIEQVRRDFLSDALSVKGDLAVGLSEHIQLSLSPALRDLTYILQDETRGTVQRFQAALAFFLAAMLLTMLTVGWALYRPLANKIVWEIRGDPDAPKTNLLRFDAVTGLANRAHLLSLMTDHCGFIQSHGQRSAVLDVDVQGVDAVRSELSVEDSNELMSMIARRIESVCRSGDFIARVGDAEFVIVFTSFDEDTALNDMTNALRTKLSLPLTIDQNSYNFKTKIGIKVATAKDQVPAAILNQAAAALKIAKASDNYDIQFFSGNQAPKAKQREQETEQIREGLKNGQFVAHFQPIIDLETDQTLGLESLARWHHPRRGVLSPIHFLENVKNAGLSNDVTRAVLGDALKGINGWAEDAIDVPYVSINIDTLQLKDAAFVDELKWIVESYNMPAHRIALEFSEAAFLDEVGDQVKENIGRLSKHGFRLIIDDFGTIGLPLNTIKGVNIEHVKLDRAFVANLDSEIQQQKTTRELVEHAQTKRTKIVAAGVETPAERASLSRMNVDAIQGYLICEPVEPDQITDWFKQNANHQDRESA